MSSLRFRIRAFGRIRAALLWPLRLSSWLPCAETLQLRLWQLVANEADYSTAVARAVSPELK